MSDLILYHYVHCPYCIRVRMALGYLNLNYTSTVLAYNDEKTPTELTGIKMLPIMKIKGEIMNESLDIIEKLDQKEVFQLKKFRSSSQFEATENFCLKLSQNVHNLAMPYWIFTPEFDNESRKYFIEKKSKKRGPFNKLVHNKDIFISELNNDLKVLEQNLNPFYKSQTFTFNDIQIASFLWGMYVVPEFQFSEKVHNYLQNIGNLCNFNYHKDFWE
jgi:glutaredoxin 2